MVVGILAVLKAGGAYVPLDGSIVTQSTLEYVLQDSRSILTLRSINTAIAPNTSTRWVSLMIRCHR